MALLGDLIHVKKMLRANVSTTWDADVDDRLIMIQRGVSATLEEMMGRSFGTVAADTTQIVWAGRGDSIIFDRPARSLTSITVNGTVAGGVMTGGTVYSSSLYAHDPVDYVDGTIYGIRLLSGAWWGDVDLLGTPLVPVQIVGDFSDTDNDTTIPADITYVANYVIAEQFKIENAGPAGFTGPDGATMPIRDPFKNPLVQNRINLYRVGRRTAVV